MGPHLGLYLVLRDDRPGSAPGATERRPRGDPVGSPPGPPSRPRSRIPRPNHAQRRAELLAVAAQWRVDTRFGQAVQSAAPDGTKILQLPYVPFPENPPVQQMSDYDLLRGYLHTHGLNWTYGAMKGRPQDWLAAHAEDDMSLLLPGRCRRRLPGPLRRPVRVRGRRGVNYAANCRDPWLQQRDPQQRWPPGVLRPATVRRARRAPRTAQT